MHEHLSLDLDRSNYLENLSLSPLIAQARKKLATLPIEEALKAGITRNRSAYFLNISYPSMQAMPEVTSEEVYANVPSQAGKDIALYVHIPFCTAECYYCHYYKSFQRPSSEVDAYLSAVELEIEMHTNRYGGLRTRSIYIGGGTPSYMTPEQIDRLFQIIKRHTEVPENVEVSFEVHPENASEDRLAVLKSHHVNRINIGVESFDDKLLRSENRRHNAQEAIQAYQLARSIGFANVNLDLIYGLKGQTISSWEKTLQMIQALQPNSATMYYLRLKRGTPEYKLWQLHPEQFPSNEDLLLMHAMNFEHMETNLGYTQNPVDWYIKDPTYFHTYQDHNWRRSEDTQLLGIGASAYSYVDGWQTYNINNTATYLEMMQEGRPAIWRGEQLKGDEPLRRTVMLGIKMGMNRNDFETTYGIDVVDAFKETWERMVALQLVTINDVSVQLTYLGKLLADEVGQQFYSDQMKMRMSAIDPAMVSTTWPQFNP